MHVEPFKLNRLMIYSGHVWHSSFYPLPALSKLFVPRHVFAERMGQLVETDEKSRARFKVGGATSILNEWCVCFTGSLRLNPPSKKTSPRFTVSGCGHGSQLRTVFLFAQQQAPTQRSNSQHLEVYGQCGFLGWGWGGGGGELAQILMGLNCKLHTHEGENGRVLAQHSDLFKGGSPADGPADAAAWA